MNATSQSKFGWAVIGVGCNLLAMGAAGFGLILVSFQSMLVPCMGLFLIHTIWAVWCFRKAGRMARQMQNEWAAEVELDRMG